MHFSTQGYGYRGWVELVLMSKFRILVRFSVMFRQISREIFGELCVGFETLPVAHWLKNAALNKEYQTAVHNGHNKNGKFSLIQINGVQNRFLFEHNTLLRFHVHYICS